MQRLLMQCSSTLYTFVTPRIYETPSCSVQGTSTALSRHLGSEGFGWYQKAPDSTLGTVRLNGMACALHCTVASPGHGCAVFISCLAPQRSRAKQSADFCCMHAHADAIRAFQAVVSELQSNFMSQHRTIQRSAAISRSPDHLWCVYACD